MSRTLHVLPRFFTLVIAAALAAGCASGAKRQAEPDPEPFRPYQGEILDQRPVYTPPEPDRLWVAPYRDRADTLHGPRYMYFVRGGQWAFGASGARAPLRIEPVTPGDFAVTDPDDLPERREERRRATQPERTVAPKVDIQFPGMGE